MIDYSPYVILGLEPPASESEIKKVYRNKAKTLHPDRNLGNKKNPKNVMQSISFTRYNKPGHSKGNII